MGLYDFMINAAQSGQIRELEERLTELEKKVDILKEWVDYLEEERKKNDTES